MKSEGQRLPPWIRTRIRTGSNREFVTGLMDDLQLNTVCKSAKCPNLSECWHCKTSTIMILGERCTRSCAFCAVPSHKPLPPDPDEPEKVAKAAATMGLKFVVLTSVDRDDLKDKGAGHWAATVNAIHRELPDAGVEILTPDFMGRKELIAQVTASRPTVFNHNLETCERLTREIRSGNKYERSLDVLRLARETAVHPMAIKSGIMVGLGETDEEVEATIRDIRDADVDILTIGQYLRPTREQREVHRYVEPEQFEAWAELARGLGFKAVASAPLVRSSYKAGELATAALTGDSL